MLAHVCCFSIGVSLNEGNDQEDGGSSLLENAVKTMMPILLMTLCLMCILKCIPTVEQYNCHELW